MARRNAAEKKDILPDPKFGSKIVAKLINQVMQDGKKALAQNIVYEAFAIAAEKTSAGELETFNQALENTMPILEVKARRVGGTTYQVPMEVRAERRQTLAIRWLVSYAKKRSERGMALKLGAELADAFNQTGASVKKRDEMHRMAEANKAFAHYRW